MPKYKPREKSEETFLHDADLFCAHTIKLLKNEDVCPKSARWLGAEEIIRLAQKLHTAIHNANNIKVTNSKEREARHACQTEALALIKTLGEKFKFCTLIYSIKVDVLNNWLNQKGDIQSWLRLWQSADEKRYQNIG